MRIKITLLMCVCLHPLSLQTQLRCSGKLLVQWRSEGVPAELQWLYYYTHAAVVSICRAKKL